MLVGLNVHVDRILYHRMILLASRVVKFSKKVMRRCNILSMEGVTVYNSFPECHLTFERVEGLDIIMV